MRCSSCSHENPADATFCGECGQSLRREIVCAACGRSNAAGIKFCHGCGQRLDDSSATRNHDAGGVAAGTAAPPPKLPPPVVPAAFASGRYAVQRLLGEGSRKRVYLAHDTRLDRDVAFALIKTEGLDESGLARVRREAQAMGRLGDHPHIVTVHDIGDEDHRPYIVSQFMPGGSVDELLQRTEQHRLPLDHSLRIADQLCQALEHAHTRNVIHRDLKPGNVWLTQDGTAKLGDFGLAVAIDRSRLTLEGMMVGTVAYMPPEQALGRQPDARSDLYALGAMLYEMLTGRPPFLGDDAVAIISQHINTPPVAPSWHNPEVPRALEALLLRLLAKAPEERPESAAVVRQALQAITTAAASGVARGVTAEPSNPLDRLAGGVFVGREHEMDELRAGLEDALSGRGRLLMLVGEPGIGKTRTAEELMTYAQLRKAQVLWGRCYEGEGAPAYWPWVQAIRSYVHDRDPKALLSEMGSGAADIGQIVSEVRERLPGLPPPPTLEPEQARFRLFDGITTFLKNASKSEALVLVLDDLHWADKPSLLLLQFLARELRGARLLVIGTYRDIELGRQHPLAQALGELGREQLTQRIVLRGLSEHDVGRFIEITAGRKPPETLVAAVYKETEGNPFFVNEVVRLLVSDGRLVHPETVKSWSVDIPQGVREVISRRLDRLSDECNRVLTTASVIGREFSLELLERVSELSSDRLIDVLEEAMAARVIAEVPRAVGRYIFAHALIRETLYGELTTTRRVRSHRQIGEALEQLYGANPEPHLAELAYHFSEAMQGGDVERAIGYAVRAGDRAAALMAHEQAVHHYEMGLQALELHARGQQGRSALLLKLSDALWRAGEYDRAKAIAKEAADLARSLGAAEELARAALAYGGRLLAFAAVQPDETLIGLCEEALVRLGNSDHTLRASLLARLAEEITLAAPYERRAALCGEAVAMARRLGDPVVLAHALRAAHWALWVPENLAERLAQADEIIQLAERAGDRALLYEGYGFRLWDLCERGDVVQAQRESERHRRLADELRQPYYRWSVPVIGVFLAFMRGCLAEVEPLAQQALQLGQEAQNSNAALVFGVQMSLLLREQGRHQEEEAFMMGLDLYPLIVPNLRCARARFYLDLGREAEARAEFAELVAHFGELPRNFLWLSSLAFLAEACARLADAERAPALYEMLRPFAQLTVTIGPVVPLGSAARYLGLLAAALGRHTDAAEHFEAALAMNARMGMQQAVARTQVNYAELLLARNSSGDRAKALELLNRALDIGRTLGMKVLVEQALAVKLRTQGIVTSDFKTSIHAVALSIQQSKPDLRSHAAPDGTVTILFSDIEGSSALTERVGDQRWLELLRAHNAIVREQVATHGGFEVKSQGDGFMIAFQSARRALHCAIAIQRAFAAHNTPAPAYPIRVRIGVHTGEVIKEAADFFGKHVILAARIAAQANGGEILVSSLVRELIHSSGDFRFGATQSAELKGLSGAYSLCPVEWTTA